jgi:bacteriocin biosynthesis cyclodehydratase domain-containing protein
MSNSSKTEPPCPRLRPDTAIIRIDAHRVHIGDNPYPTLLSEAETTWLRGLPNFHSWGEALDAFPGHTQRAASVIDEVRNRGALQDPGECWWLSPQERLAAQPSLVALSTWHNHPASAIASRMASSVAVIGDDRWVSLLRETLLAGGLNAVNHTSVVPADIVIVCASVPADAPEAVLSWLPSAAQDRPHLPITAYRGRASVGPLVEPGRTPCLRCSFLHHRDTNHLWPSIISQWIQHRTNLPVATDSLLASHSAVHAVAMVRNWIDSSERASPRRIVIETPSFRASEHLVAAHPECGCLWGAGAPAALRGDRDAQDRSTSVTMGECPTFPRTH